MQNSAIVSIKMDSMSLGRQIVGFASAALVAALMLFAPTSAQAHMGHDHGASTRMLHSEAAPPSQTSAGQPSQARSVQQASASSHDQASASSHDEVYRRVKDDQRDGNCTGGCCGNGLGCCGAVLIAPLQDLPDIAYHGTEFLSDFAYRPGIDSDALSRPPRILA